MADSTTAPRRPAVLAVVVSSGLTSYLPETLHGLASQTSRPDAVLVVDVTPAPDGGHVRTSALRTAAHDAGLPLEDVRVAHVPSARNFGEAVRQGLAQLEDQGSGGAQLARATWLWLLHDDSAPEPNALGELLRVAKSGSSIAIVGAKQRDWARPEHILEVGVTVSRTGRRYLGLEEGELDQGQHDGREDVYGVGTAGALVVTEVWSELGGPDPVLGPFGDGLDLSRRARLAGYRVVVAPRAVVRHARAGYLGLRPPADSGSRAGTAPPDVRRSYRARRSALLYTRLLDTSRWALPFRVLQVLLSTVVHVLARVVTKEFRLAADEVAATAAVLSRPRSLLRARARTTAQRRIPPRRLRPLRATAGEAWRVGHERRLQSAAERRGRLVRSDLELAERAALATHRRWVWTLVVLALAVVATVVLAPFLTAGPLTGGALLPVASDVGTLWQRAVSAWTPTADGHPGPTDPFLHVLVALAVLAGGSARAATTALLVAAVPLAGLGAWFAAGAVTRSLRLRAWAALVWALAPPLVLALGQGRLGPLVAHLLLPWAALGVARALGVQRVDELAGPGVAPQPPPRGSVAAAAAAGLALAAAAAGAPVLLPAALVALALLALVVRRRRGMLLLVAVPPVALLAPLLLEATSDVAAGSWRVLAADPGLPLASAAGPSYETLLGWPESPLPWPVLTEAAATVAPLVASAVLVLGAVVALVRRGWLRAVRAGWVLMAVGLAAALAASRVEVGIGRGLTTDGALPGAGDAETGSGLGQVVHGWAGSGTSLLLLGVLVAVVGAADGLVGRLASSSFGWRQVGAAGLAALLVTAPAANGVAWVWRAIEARSAEGADAVLALEGRGRSPVPALGAEVQRSAQDARVLAVEPVGEELLVRLWRGDGDQLDEFSAAIAARALTGTPGSAAVVGPDEAEAHLAGVVAGLALGSAEDAGAELARHAVAVVVVPPGHGEARDALVARVDATRGLERVTENAPCVATRQTTPVAFSVTRGLERVTENATGVVWRVATQGAVPVARAVVVSPDGALEQVVPSQGVAARGPVAAGEPGRLLVLAERADEGWRAWLDGRPLRATSSGWQQAFALPPRAGEVSVTHMSWPLTLVHSAQAVVLGLFAILALPIRRRRAGVS